MCLDKSINLNQIKYFVSAIFTAFILLQSSQSLADFRKALVAYQASDKQTMLAEMQDAVDKKNDDGFILFISVLETDAWLSPFGDFSDSPLGKILNEQEANQFASLLRDTAQFCDSRLLLRFRRYLRAYGAASNINSSKIYSDELYKKVYFSEADTQKEMRIATGYLFDKAGVKKDERTGLSVLKKALAQADAYLYWGGHSNKISQYYFEKFLQNNKKYYLKQAYAWAVLGYTDAIFFANHYPSEPPTTIKEMQTKGLLTRLSPQLNAILSSDYNRSDRKATMQRATAILSVIDKVELPDLIKENYNFDSSRRPIITLQRINYDSWKSMMGDEYMTGAGTSISNFSVEIYEDGRVAYAQGKSGNLPFKKEEPTTILLTLSPQEVRLLHAIITSEVKQTPQVAIGQQEYGYCTARGGCRNAEYEIDFAENYTVSVRDKNGFLTVKFLGSNLPRAYAKVYKLIEEHAHTQQYRCGTDKSNKYYLYCVNRDKQIFELANTSNH